MGRTWSTSQICMISLCMGYNTFLYHSSVSVCAAQASNQQPVQLYIYIISDIFYLMSMQANIMLADFKTHTIASRPFDLGQV